VFGWGIPCYRIARYVSIALVVEFFGASGMVEVVGVKRLFALWGWYSSLDLRNEKPMCYWCDGLQKV